MLQNAKTATLTTNAANTKTVQSLKHTNSENTQQRNAAYPVNTRPLGGVLGGKLEDRDQIREWSKWVT